jgi:hypothetical protein
VKTIEISWNLNTEPDIASYKVYENGTVIDTIAHPIHLLTLSRIDGTYAYRVSAVDSSGNESELTDPISIVIDSVPPAKPTGLKALIKN